jgi:uncharacterized protein YceH (UPF0502 family)
MAVLLPKAAGTREPRWTHLRLGEPVLPAAAGEPIAPLDPSPLADRVAALEAEVQALKDQFPAFRKQFE